MAEFIYFIILILLQVLFVQFVYVHLQCIWILVHVHPVLHNHIYALLDESLCVYILLCSYVPI